MTVEHEVFENAVGWKELLVYQIVWKLSNDTELYYTCSDNSYLYYTSVVRDAPFWLDPADACDVLRRIEQ